jgi:hypothetical protein
MIFETLTDEQQQRIQDLETTKDGQPALDLNRDVSIENEKYIVIESLKQIIGSPEKRTYGYYYIVMCKDCGYIKKITKGDFTNNYKPAITCKQCNLTKNRLAFVGFENSIYKVLSFDHEKNKSLYYKCRCKKCGNESIVRKDNITKKDLKCCINCKGNGVVPSAQSPINAYRYHYKNGAKSRGFDWKLSDSEFDTIIKQPCHYCGALPKPIQSLKRYTHVEEEICVNGIDRIDSTKSYIIDNCVPCCAMCNRMKSDYNLTDFITHVRKISNFYKSSTTIENTSESDGSE